MGYPINLGILFGRQRLSGLFGLAILIMMGILSLISILVDLGRLVSLIKIANLLPRHTRKANIPMFTGDVTFT